MFRYDGHSGRVTPGPIPNPEVKPARVPVCTVLRKRTGTQARCQPLFIFKLWPRGCFSEKLCHNTLNRSWKRYRSMFRISSTSAIIACTMWTRACSSPRSWIQTNMSKPSSVIGYVQNGFEPGSYRKTGCYDGLISKLISNADERNLENLRHLCSGQSINHFHQDSISLRDLQNKHVSSTLLVSSGHLGIANTDSENEVSVPD